MEVSIAPGARGAEVSFLYSGASVPTACAACCGEVDGFEQVTHGRGEDAVRLPVPLCKEHRGEAKKAVEVKSVEGLEMVLLVKNPRWAELVRRVNA